MASHPWVFWVACWWAIGFPIQRVAILPPISRGPIPPMTEKSSHDRKGLRHISDKCFGAEMNFFIPIIGFRSRASFLFVMHQETLHAS